MENVIALLLLVLLSWVKTAAPTHEHRKPGRAETSATERSARRVARTSGSCESLQDCAWGYAGESGQCVEAGCHPARRVSGRVISARRCDEGASCAYEDGASQAHGAGYCEPGAR